MTLVKLCGLMSRRDVEMAIDAGADMVGMVLSEGFRRSVPLEEAKAMAALAKGKVTSVGVFVDEPIERLASIALAHSLGMSALVEVHDAEEMGSAVRCGARIVGVNNRNLRDFTVDPLNCLRLAGGVPEDVIFVAESGVSSRADVEALEAGGADAVLIGESLMRSPDKAAKLAELRGSI